MEYLILPDVFEKIAFYLKDVDLYTLMETCKDVRDYIGLSNIWKKMHRHTKFDGILEVVDIREAFELFKSLKICKTNFQIRDYYGEWYYLYVLKTWIGEDYWNFWSIHSLINNQKDIEILCRLSGFVNEPRKAMEYHKWINLIKKLSENLLKIKDIEKDEILKRIYINGLEYDNEDKDCLIYITDKQINYYRWDSLKAANSKHTLEDMCVTATINPGDFYYTISFIYYDYSYNDVPQCAISKNEYKMSPCSRENFPQMIKKISRKMEFSYEIFMKLIVIVLGKFGYQCARSIQDFAYGDVEKTEPDPLPDSDSNSDSESGNEWDCIEE